MTALAHVLNLDRLLRQEGYGWIMLLVPITGKLLELAMRKRSANLRYAVSWFALCIAILGSGLYLTIEKESLALWLPSLQACSVWLWCSGVGLVFWRRLAVPAKFIYDKRRRSEPAGEALLAVASEVASRMRLDRRVNVLISSIDSPCTIGHRRPVILLPPATKGLTPKQLEAVFAHELAHIRRYDYLVNMLQKLTESLLFFNPAVWAASECISRERELCCDDEAARACGHSVLARALTELEKLRCPVGGVKPTPGLALGVTEFQTTYRINRLIRIAKGFETDSMVPRVSHEMAFIIWLGLLNVLFQLWFQSLPLE